MVRMTKIIGLTPGPRKSKKGVMTSLLHDIMMSCCHDIYNQEEIAPWCL